MKTFLLLIAAGALAFAQNNYGNFVPGTGGPVTTVIASANPSGPCLTPNQKQYNYLTGHTNVCNGQPGAMTWTDIDAGGTGGGSPAVFTTVTYSGTPTFTCSSSTADTFKITLTGAVSSSTLASCSTGERVNFQIIQDGTGGRSYVGPTNVLNACSVSQTLSVTTIMTGVYDGTNVIVDGCATTDTATLIAGPERAAVTSTASGQGALSFDSASHTVKYYSNNSATAKVMPAATDCTATAGQVVSKINSDGTVTCTTQTGTFIPIVITNSTITAATTGYAFIATLNTAENIRQVPMNAPGTLKNFYLVTTGTQPNTTGNIVCTWRKNAADVSGGPSITIAPNAAAGTFTDTTNSFTVAAGDLVDMKCVNTLTSTTAAFASGAITFYPN